MRFAGRRNITVGAAGSHGADCGDESGDVLFSFGEVKRCVVFRIRSDHDTFAVVGKSLPYFLGYKGHERMQKLHCMGDDVDKNLLRLAVGCRTLCGKAGLYEFDIPVAEYVPDEIIQLGNGNAEFVFFKVFGDLADKAVVKGKQPFVLRFKTVGCGLIYRYVVVKIHHRESRCVPDLICKVTARFDTFGGETHIVSGAVAGCEGESQSIGTVLIDDLKRVDAVAEGFRHFSALRVTHKTVENDSAKWRFAGMFQTGEDHSRDPEEDYIISGDEHACRIEMLEIIGLFGPAEC